MEGIVGVSVSCGKCAERIETKAKMPLHILDDDFGNQYIPTDYSKVYEHIRDNHPELWTEAMATEYELHKAGKV